MSSKKQMCRKKALLGVLTLFIFIAAFSPLIKVTNAASDDVLAFYDWASATDNCYLTAEHPSPDSDKSGYGNVFLVNGSRYLTQIDIKFKRAGSPSFSFTMYVSNVTAQAATNSVPTSPIVAQSTTEYVAMSISTSETIYSFFFNQTYQLQDGVYYAWYLVTTDYVTGDNVNCIQTRFDSSSSYGDGNYFAYASSAWTQNNSYDFVFYVYGNIDAAAAEEEPEDYWFSDGTLAQLGSYIVTFFIILLPSIVLGLLFKMGKWGYIIGIIIGSGLGYILFPTIVPLWVVFLVGTGVFAMILLGRDKI